MTGKSILPLLLLIIVLMGVFSSITIPAKARQYHLEILVDSNAVYNAMGVDEEDRGRLVVEYASLTIPWARILLPDKIDYRDDGILISFSYTDIPENASIIRGANIYPAVAVAVADYDAGKEAALIIRSTSILVANKTAGNGVPNDKRQLLTMIKQAIDELSRDPLKAVKDATVAIDGDMVYLLKQRNDLVVKDIRPADTDDQSSLSTLDLGWHVICDGGVVVEHAVDTSHPDAGTPMPGWWSGRVLTGDPEVRLESWKHFRDYLLAGVYRFEKGSSWATAITCIVEKAFNTYPGYPGGMVSQLPMDSFLATFTSAYAPADWLDYSQNATGNNNDPIVIPMLVPLLNFTVINTVDTGDSIGFAQIIYSVSAYASATGLSGFYFAGIPIDVSEWNVDDAIHVVDTVNLSDTTMYFLVPAIAVVDKDTLYVHWRITEDANYYYVRPEPLLTPRHMITIVPTDLIVDDTYDPPFPFYTRASLPSTVSFDIGKTNYPGNYVTLVTIKANNTESPSLEYEAISIGSPILDLLPDILYPVTGVPGAAIRASAKALSSLMYVNSGSNEEFVGVIFKVKTVHRPEVNSYRITVENMVPYKVAETDEFVDWMHWGGIKVVVTVYP